MVVCKRMNRSDGETPSEGPGALAAEKTPGRFLPAWTCGPPWPICSSRCVLFTKILQGDCLHHAFGHGSEDLARVLGIAICEQLHGAPRGRQETSPSHSGTHAVTVISTRSSGEFSITSTVVRAGLLSGK